MARNRPCVVMAWAAFVLPLTLIGADADEQEDREAIRALFHQEQEGHRLGDEQMVRTAHWEDFYVIGTPHIDGVSRYMLSGINLGKDYLAGFNYQPRPTTDESGFSSEVNHIAINGDVALAVTQFNYWGPSDGGISNAGHQAMWIAEKRNDTWKWKSVIVGFETFRELRPAPQADEEAE